MGELTLNDLIKDGIILVLLLIAFFVIMSGIEAAEEHPQVYEQVGQM